MMSDTLTFPSFITAGNVECPYFLPLTMPPFSYLRAWF